MGKRGNLWRRVRAVLGLVGILAVTIPSLFWMERVRGREEEIAVYSAYLSASVPAVSGNPRFDVIVEDVTYQERLGLTHGFSDSSISTRASYVLRNLFRTRIRHPIAIPGGASALLVRHDDIEVLSRDPKGFLQKHPNFPGDYYTLSSVGFNASRTQALFHVDHYCPLCGSSGYVTLDKVGGRWKVRDKRYSWVS